MKTTFLFIFFTFILLSAFSSNVFAVCEYDTQCKGDRVCEHGECVSPAPTAHSPQCSNGAFEDGECIPAGNDPNISNRVRGKLYLRCVRSGGHDEFTGQCCDHLTTQLASVYKVCGKGGGGGVSGAQINDLPWDVLVPLVLGAL